MAEGGFTVSWLGAFAGALWLTAGVLVVLNLAFWSADACIGRAGIFVGLVAVAFTVCNGQRKREAQIEAVVERAAARQEFAKLRPVGPQRVN